MYQVSVILYPCGQCLLSSVTMRTCAFTLIYTHLRAERIPWQCVHEINESLHVHMHFLALLIIHSAKCLPACVQCVFSHVLSVVLLSIHL